MTTIRLHGILGKEYSDVFSLKIGNPSSVFSAIDCNRKGFLKRVVDNNIGDGMIKNALYRVMGWGEGPVIEELEEGKFDLGIFKITINNLKTYEEDLIICKK